MPIEIEHFNNLLNIAIGDGIFYLIFKVKMD